MVYKFTLKPKGPVGTPFRSDTLFGHACWTMRLKYGKEEFESFMEDARNQQPQLVFSDGFPRDHLPMPILPTAANPVDSLEQIKRTKKLKTMRWIKKEVAEKNRWKITEKILPEKLIDIPDQMPKGVAQMHNIIDRITGTALEKHGIYSVVSEWYDGIWKEVDIYVYSSSWTRDQLDVFVERMFRTGYGRDQTVGKGAVEVCSPVTETELPAKEKSHFFMSLSRCVPDSSVDLERSCYRLISKYGKVWQMLETVNPFKKPILQTEPGSVFFCSEQRDLYGTVLTDMHDDMPVVENCMTIPWFIPEEVCNV